MTRRKWAELFIQNFAMAEIINQAYAQDRPHTIMKTLAIEGYTRGRVTWIPIDTPGAFSVGVTVSHALPTEQVIVRVAYMDKVTTPDAPTPRTVTSVVPAGIAWAASNSAPCGREDVLYIEFTIVTNAEFQKFEGKDIQKPV